MAKAVRRWPLLLLPAALLLAACGRHPALLPPPAATPVAVSPTPGPGDAPRFQVDRQAIEGQLDAQEVGRVWSSGGRWLWLATAHFVYEIDFAQSRLAMRTVWQAADPAQIFSLAAAAGDRLLLQTRLPGGGFALLLLEPAKATARALVSGGKAGPVVVTSAGGGRVAFTEQGTAGVVVMDLPSAQRRVFGEAGALPQGFQPGGNTLVAWVPKALAGERSVSGDNPGYLVLIDLTAGTVGNLSDWYAALQGRGWDSTGTYYLAEARRHPGEPPSSVVWHRKEGQAAELPGQWRWDGRLPLTLVNAREALAVTLPDTKPAPAKPQQVNAAGLSPDGHWQFDATRLRERQELAVLDAVSGAPLLRDAPWLRADWSPASDRVVAVNERGQWVAFVLASS